MLDKLSADKSQAVMCGLLKLWDEFSASLDQVPIIDKLNRGKFRLDDYRELLRNHRQQVVEGARWIARASSSIGEDYLGGP
jgi:3-oxoacyl-[acyl-carrier-protein] synthase III